MKAKTREAVREDAKRQHRVLGMYCALYCWHHQKDAIFVSRDLFLEFIGLERLKDIRFKWLQDDINSYFPYVFTHKKENASSTKFVVLSRLSKSDLMTNTKKAIYFEPAIFQMAKKYSTDLQLEALSGVKTNTASIPFISSVENIYEFSISSTLSSLVSGLVCPKAALSEKNA